MSDNEQFTPPPMGWNSWYCHSESVSDKCIREAAQAMVDTGLSECGWKWINIDDCWQGVRGGKFNAIQGNERFPDMSALGEYIHSRGLKFGLYSTPWISTYAGFRGGSDDGGLEKRLYLPENDRLQLNQVFGRFPMGRDSGSFRIGSNWLFSYDVQQWVEWGIDMVKVDWYPNDVPTTMRIFANLKDCGNHIHLSLSNNAQIEFAQELLECALICRISCDIQDSWESVYHNGFIQGSSWVRFIRPGHYIDPDMLQIGNLGRPNDINIRTIPTRLTQEEQRTQLSLWCLLSAPLLLSCDMRSLDAFSINTLCNRDVIAIDQDPLADAPCICMLQDGIMGYIKRLWDGTHAIGIFNISDQAQTIEYIFPADSLELWTKELFQAGVKKVRLSRHSGKLLRTIR